MSSKCSEVLVVLDTALQNMVLFALSLFLLEAVISFVLLTCALFIQ